VKRAVARIIEGSTHYIELDFQCTQSTSLSGSVRVFQFRVEFRDRCGRSFGPFGPISIEPGEFALTQVARWS
jgi:hypothetical protein